MQATVFDFALCITYKDYVCTVNRTALLEKLIILTGYFNESKLKSVLTVTVRTLHFY